MFDVSNFSEKTSFLCTLLPLITYSGKSTLIAFWRIFYFWLNDALAELGLYPLFYQIDHLVEATI
jgi:hypothetical protein